MALVRVEQEAGHASQELDGGGGSLGAAQRGGEDAEGGGVRGGVRRGAEEDGGGDAEERRGRAERGEEGVEGAGVAARGEEGGGGGEAAMASEGHQQAVVVVACGGFRRRYDVAARAHLRLCRRGLFGGPRQSPGPAMAKDVRVRPAASSCDWSAASVPW